MAFNFNRRINPVIPTTAIQVRNNVFYACQIEAMSVVGEAVVNSYTTKRVLTPGTKTTTVNDVVTTTGTTIN